MIIKIARFIYKTANLIVELLGILLLVILCVWSITILKGVSIEYTKALDLKPLLSGDLPKVWLGVFAILLIGMTISIISQVIKGIKKGTVCIWLLKVCRRLFEHIKCLKSFEYRSVV